MVIISPKGLERERYVPVRKHSQCVFEHVYFSRPDSVVFGRPVQQSREMLAAYWRANAGGRRCHRARARFRRRRGYRLRDRG